MFSRLLYGRGRYYTFSVRVDHLQKQAIEALHMHLSLTNTQISQLFVQNVISFNKLHVQKGLFIQQNIGGT